MIQAFRYALTDADDAHDYIFQPAIVGLLTSMLNDADLENARLGLTTLNAAAHNKPHLISPQLGQLLPLVMRATEIKPELIREVQMGPFKHKVDDGIELRKVSYSGL
jgi:cullin-associated NEDD8-dissociated protein 1